MGYHPHFRSARRALSGCLSPHHAQRRPSTTVGFDAAAMSWSPGVAVHHRVVLVRDREALSSLPVPVSPVLRVVVQREGGHHDVEEEGLRQGAADGLPPEPGSPCLGRGARGGVERDGARTRAT